MDSFNVLKGSVLELCPSTGKHQVVILLLDPVLILFVCHELIVRNICVPDLQQQELHLLETVGRDSVGWKGLIN